MTYGIQNDKRVNLNLFMKDTNMFVCSNCGHESSKWLGRCPSCNEWNSFKEMHIAKAKKGQANLNLGQSKGEKLSSKKVERMNLGIPEIDHVLGGGLVSGSVILIGGDPGVGKSTMALQLASRTQSLYVSGEEDLYQISDRWQRIAGEKQLDFLSTNSLNQALAEAENKKPKLLVIDSLQTMIDEDSDGAAGSISQVKAVTLKLVNFAKTNRVPILIIGHVTKAGAVAGPRTVEHMVDVVLYLEGERYGFYRLLRSVKNRFGPVSEVGVFEMTKTGLLPVKNPSEIFLNFTKASGSVQACILEGTRPIFVTIEALVTRTFSPYPKRTAIGLDLNRLLLILAVLEKRLKLKFYDQDVFLKVSGGLRVNEPAGDLAVAMALISSLKDKKIDPYSVFWGEVALSGAIKEVIAHELRLKEAKKLGFKKAIVPKTKKPFESKQIKIIALSDLSDLNKILD
jgi:DNA repair protein RadA/Sms